VTTTEHAHIATIGAEDFEDRALGGAGAIVVEFMSYGCAHCRTLEPIVQQVAARLASDVTFFRVNIGTDAALATAYAIRGTPTLLMLRAGREVGRIEGPPPSVSGIVQSVTETFAT
jgi:thioredoxin 1